MAETERVRGWWEERRPDKGQGITRQGLHFSFLFFFFFWLHLPACGILIP